MLSIYYLTIVLFLPSRMSSASSPEERIDVSTSVGGNVTLQVLYRGVQRILDVTWVTADGNHFATTKLNGNVYIRDDHYTGKLHGSNDASLIIIHVTVEDQGLYRASIYPLEGEPYGIMYNLSISEKTPDKNTVTHDEASTPNTSSGVGVSFDIKNGNRGRSFLLASVMVVMVVVAATLFLKGQAHKHQGTPKELGFSSCKGIRA